MTSRESAPEERFAGTITVPRLLLAEAYRGLKRTYEMPEVRAEIDRLLAAPISETAPQLTVVRLNEKEVAAPCALDGCALMRGEAQPRVVVAPDALAREYAKDCETLARYIVPTAPKFVRDIADGWIGDDERESERDSP